jgi:fibronectin type 3 domain-containing protein
VVPANPTNLTATGATTQRGKFSVNLAWTDNASNETGFDIERSPDGVGFAQIGTTAANVTSYADTTAISGTAYYYRVAAFNAAGNSGYSNTASVAGASGPPAAPSKISATAVSASQINLKWQDNSTNETGFAIERSLDGVSFSPLNTVGTNVTAYADTGLTSNTRYYYRVRSYNGAVFSAYSNTAFTTTPRK